MNTEKLSAQEIREAIVSYVQENVYQYAVMLDGEWGCGKSYLVEHEIAPMFAKGGILGKKKYIYISLYGISSLEALEAAVSSEYITAMLGKKKAGLVQTISALGPVWLKTIDWNGEALSDSSGTIMQMVKEHFVQLNDCFFVFDDLERCCIPSVEVLGYINRLIEHNHCKALIIANERECGHAVKPREELRLIAAAMIEENRQGVLQKERVGNIQSLKEELFGNKDTLYFRTKEKLIGKTLRYEADLELTVAAITDQVIDKLIGNMEINKIVSETCIKAMQEERTKNMRILQYALSIFAQVFEVIQSIKMDEEEREQILRQVMDAALRISVRYKKDENVDRSLFQWNDKSAYGEVYCEEEPSFGNDKQKYVAWMKRRFFSFRFIHQYILTGKMDLGMAKRDLEAYAEILSNERKLNEDGYTKLRNGYWHLTEAEMHAAIMKMEERFLENGYQGNIYLQVISTSLLYSEMFHIGNPEKLCSHLVEEIEKGRISVDLHYDMLGQRLEGIADEKFRQCLAAIERINEKEKEEADRAFFNCFILENWSEVYRNLDRNRDLRSKLMVKERFSSLIDIPSLVLAINQGTSEEVYYVMQAFAWVYEENCRHFMKDRTSIEELIQGIGMIKTDDCIKRKVLEGFDAKLKEIRDEFLRIESGM